MESKTPSRWTLVTTPSLARSAQAGPVGGERLFSDEAVRGGVRLSAVGRETSSAVTSSSHESVEEIKEDQRLSVPKMLTGKRLKRYETRICLGGQIQTNSGVSYVAQWNIAGGGSANNTLAWSQVSNAAEFTSLDALFDEFFIKQTTLRYVPHNRYSGQGASSYNAATAAGAPGYMNTCMATVIFLPHNSAVYSSGAAAFVNARSAEQSKVVDMGQPWVLKARNTEKFSWDGPLGDQSTSGATMSWGQIGSTSKYGGTHQLLLAQSSGSSVGAGTFPESALMGDFILEFDIAFRARA